MKTLIKKEIRLLLPAWVAAMALAVAPAWLIEYFLPHQNALVEVPPIFFICLGLLLLGISSFGQEFSAKTFSLLLSQPLLRNRAWWLKTSLLAIAFGLVLAAEVISWGFFVQLHPAYSSHFSGAFPGVLLWAIVLFSGALWTTLLLRQEIGAFWITLLVPVAIQSGAIILTSRLNWSDTIFDRVVAIAFVIYSAAGFLFAKRMFLHAQDTQWTGGNFFFWRRNRREHASSFIFGPVRNRFAVLVWKEVQLHEANLFIAAIVFAVNLGAVGLLPFISNPNLKGVLEFVWGLWLLMPLLIGCAAVAEERRVGVLESQLCLPVSRGAQFLIKFSVALAFSVILGAVMPTVIEWSRNFGVTDWGDFWIFYAAPALFLVSFYASTLARTTLQAIGVAMAIPIVIAAGIPVFFKVIVNPESVFYSGYRAAGIGMLTIVIGSPLMVLILGLQGFRNFKWFWENWQLYLRNLAFIIVAFAATLILTNVVYYRTWEWVTSHDGHFGPARVSDSSAPRLLAGHGAVAALFPDGKLWTEEIDFENYHTWSIVPSLSTQHYIGGSDWIDAGMDRCRLAAVRSDGSLWTVSKQFVNQARAYPLARIGSGNDWLRVGGCEPGFLLIKKDGTLWLWGRTNNWSWSEDELKTDLAVPPKRVSDETDWIGFVHPYSDMDSLIQKSDKSIWMLQWVPASHPSGQWHGSFQIKPLPGPFQGFASGAYSYNEAWRAAVTTNGQLWLSRTIGHIEKFQLGENAEWEAVTFTSENSIIALRRDGTLWTWGAHGPWTPNPASIKPHQLGMYSSWLAMRPIGWNNEGSIVLAADGSLWCWDDPSDHIWLAPSRNPVYMGNIFEGTDAADQPAARIKTHENAD